MRADEKERSAYHHGDLPRVLREKAIELLDERGVEGFSLREVARRAKVAAAAPSHHFGNVTGLLTAVAAEGFRRLASEFADVLAREMEPAEHVVGICEAYVAHQQRYPGTVSIMFRHELLDNENAELIETRPESLRLLKESVRNAIAKGSSEERVEQVAKVLWATMHGLVTLGLEERDAISDRVAFAARSFLKGADAIE